MHPSQMDEIVRRLVANPHDETALATAHSQGQHDPRGYAMLLERVGEMSVDTTYAAHWLSEAANVWALTIGDARRAATLLMRAIEKDPTSDVASDRLAQLYRDKNDHRALVALYERRAKALAPIVQSDPSQRQRLSILHEDLGRLWQEPPLNQPKKAIENYRKAFEIDPGAVAAIYAARELLKAEGNVKDALPLYDLEIQAVDNTDRKMMLLRDEAALRQSSGDGKGATATLRDALRLDPGDTGLMYELATSIISRVLNGERVPEDERAEAADLLVRMAEQYDGEHALAYSEAALDAQPAHDRAMQLAAHFARQLGRDAQIAPRWAEYVKANPNGVLAFEGRKSLARSYEEQNNLEEAIRVLEPVKNDPDPSVAMRLGELYSRAGRTSELAEHMDRQAASLPPTERLHKQLEIAAMLASKGDKKAALVKYSDVLNVDPQQPEALAFVEDALRSSRQWKELRDVMLAAARVSTANVESRRSRLREVANLSETQLKDVDGAISAYKQLLSLDRGDEVARSALHRLLEKTSRWDELAQLLEQEAMSAADQEEQIALEKKLAELHETKRGDKKEAAEALLRVVQHSPKDDVALAHAVTLLVEVGDLQRAAASLDDAVGSLDPGPAKGQLLVRLAELRERLGDHAASSDAFAEAGELLHDSDVWRRAEEAAVKVERWDQAATCVGRRGDLEHDPLAQARLRATEAQYLMKSGDASSAILRLEQAVEAAVDDDDLAGRLEQMYEQEGRFDDLAAFMVRRAEATHDEAKSIALLKRSALFRKERLSDGDGARELLLRVVEKTEDEGALSLLVEDSIERSEPQEAIGYLGRLEKLATTKEDKIRVALRQASLLADEVGEVDDAIRRYRGVLESLDPDCREALQAIADLEEARERFPEAADALERDLELAAHGEEKANIARRLGEIYVEHTHELGKSLAAFEVVMREDPEDFAALQKLRELSERAEKWPRVVELLDAQIEVEGDDEEIAILASRKAEVLADHLERVEEALRGLAMYTAAGSEDARAAALAIADRHGAHAQIGGQILAWARTTPGPEGQRLLGEAFDRFHRGEALDRALEIAGDLLRTPRGKDAHFLEQLEPMAIDEKAQELVLEIHDRRASLTSGAARAQELIRQAKVRIALGVDVEEAIGHGEIGLGAVPPAEAVPLIAELAALAPRALLAVELYERQIGRCKAPADKLAAIVRAYRRAIESVHVSPDEATELEAKAKELAEMALAVGGADDPFDALFSVAREVDEQHGTDRRTIVIATMHGSAVGPRDGGRTRSAQLRRAAHWMREELNDEHRAFELLALALVAHVDAPGLDAVEEAAGDDPRRAELVLTRALEEVFDGPLVRQIISRRAQIRQQKLGDVDGALADLKKLHELAPADATVTERYSSLLHEANDYKGLVHLLEDQILRSKDQNMRADLARQIARLWEERLGEAREAADAWRRVLRLKPQDPEATAGLDRAKRNKLNFEAGAFPAQRPPAPPSTPPPAVEPREELFPSSTTLSVSKKHSEPPTFPGSMTPPAEAYPSGSKLAAAALPAIERPTPASRISSSPPSAIPSMPATPSTPTIVVASPAHDEAPPTTNDSEPLPDTTAEVPIYSPAATGAFGVPAPQQSEVRAAASLPWDDDDENMATVVGDSQAIAEADARRARNLAAEEAHRQKVAAEAQLHGVTKTDEISVVNMVERMEDDGEHAGVVIEEQSPDDSAEMVSDEDVEEVEELDEDDVIETGQRTVDDTPAKK